MGKGIEWDIILLSYRVVDCSVAMSGVSLMVFAMSMLYESMKVETLE